MRTVPCDVCGFYHLPQLDQCAERLRAAMLLVDPRTTHLVHIGTHEIEEPWN